MDYSVDKKTLELLFLLKKRYHYSYFIVTNGVRWDEEASAAAISEEGREFLRTEGRVPFQYETYTHDEINAELRSLTAKWTLHDAASVFIASLWSSPWIWRTALTAKVFAAVLPLHEYTAYSETYPGGSCGICSMYPKGELDPAYEWHRSLTEGLLAFRQMAEPVLLLREMEKLRQQNPIPIPTEYDLWTFSAIITVINNLPPKARYSRAAKILKAERLLPSNNTDAYITLLEWLGFIGLLDTPEHPGMATKFTTYLERDMRPNDIVNATTPLGWWNSSFGVNKENFDKLFGTFSLPLVDLSKPRPEPIPAFSETLTGALSKKRKSDLPI